MCRFQYETRGAAFPGGVLEGTAIIRRDRSKPGMWFDRNLMGFRQKPSSACEKELPGAILKTRPLTRKQLYWKGPGGAGNTNFVVDTLSSSLQCTLVAAELS